MAHQHPHVRKIGRVNACNSIQYQALLNIEYYDRGFDSRLTATHVIRAGDESNDREALWKETPCFQGATDSLRLVAGANPISRWPLNARIDQHVAQSPPIGDSMRRERASGSRSILELLAGASQDRSLGIGETVRSLLVNLREDRIDLSVEVFRFAVRLEDPELLPRGA